MTNTKIMPQDVEDIYLSDEMTIVPKKPKATTNDSGWKRDAFLGVDVTLLGDTVQKDIDALADLLRGKPVKSLYFNAKDEDPAYPFLAETPFVFGSNIDLSALNITALEIKGAVFKHSLNANITASDSVNIIDTVMPKGDYNISAETLDLQGIQAHEGKPVALYLRGQDWIFLSPLEGKKTDVNLALVKAPNVAFINDYEHDFVMKKSLADMPIEADFIEVSHIDEGITTIDLGSPEASFSVPKSTKMLSLARVDIKNDVKLPIGTKLSLGKEVSFAEGVKVFVNSIRQLSSKDMTRLWKEGRLTITGSAAQRKALDTAVAKANEGNQRG